jgi:hypothetical protein
MKDVADRRQAIIVSVVAAVGGYLAVWLPWVLAGFHKNMVDGMRPISLLDLTLLGLGCGLTVPHYSSLITYSSLPTYRRIQAGIARGTNHALPC